MNGKVSKDSESVREYIFAGKACFTLVNTIRGTRITYILKRSKRMPECIFVYVKINNEEKFMGCVWEETRFTLSKKSQVSDRSTEVLTMVWFMQHINHLTEYPNLDIYHDGCCGRCGKQLTVPESIATGLGPECAKITRRSAIVRKAVIQELFPVPTHPVKQFNTTNF